MLFSQKINLFSYFIDKKTDKEGISNLPNVLPVRSARTIEFRQRGCNNLC